MKPILVSLKDRSYEIRFSNDNRALAGALRQFLKPPARVLLVTTAAVMKSGHLSPIANALRATDYRTASCVIPNGESHKSLRTMERLYKSGFQLGLDRKSLILAVGGGVVTDLAGFLAATYMRGISYISVPTTVLAMVDAAIGGKTGVDMPEGKNLVGAFWQPRLVWVNPKTLATLPRREWKTGFAEIIKYGVIKDSVFFSWLERKVEENPDVSNWVMSDVERALRRSAEIKARVVSADERESPLKGGREILNFGHTVGHALESARSYASLSHGEAISIGMNVAGQIALVTGLWSSSSHSRMISLLRKAGLPVQFPKLDKKAERQFWEALQKDKKHISGQLRFVLPTKVGSVVVKSGVPERVVRNAIRECAKFGYTPA